ncbi:MAG TPA: hypothetical protein VMS17_16690 [Gemmataceae bacterium]|nr:hypothetical protein [Gemmataceae bacterium]
MLAAMTAREWWGWQVYGALEPWGGRQDDLRCGILASLIANWSMDRDPKAKPLVPADFFPGLKEDEPEEPRPQTLEEQALQLDMMAAAFCGAP